jgi:KDO2-lipid IV(A) lauroyltransferase
MERAGVNAVVRPRGLRQRRKPWKKRVKHALAYVVMRVFWTVLSALPERALMALGRGLGRLLCLTPAYTTALKNIRLAYGAEPPSEKFPTAEALAAANMEHYGLTLAEVLLLDRWGKDLMRRSDVPPELLSLGKSVAARGNGILVATGHIGNWEALGRALALLEFDVWSLAKAPFDGRVADWLEDWRARGGVKIVNRGNQGGMRQLRTVVESGGYLGALVDVDTPVKSAWVPFFGRPAKTPTAAADLALKLNAALMVMWSWREAPGRFSGATLEIPVDRTADPHEESVRLTAAITAVLEKAIRAHPEQWIWVHRRWKSPPPPPPSARPAGEGAALPAARVGP